MRLPLFVQAATFPTFVRAPRSKWLSCKLLLNRPPILTWHQLTPLLTRRTVFSKAGLLCLNSYCPVPFCAEIAAPRSFVLLCCSLSAPASTIFVFYLFFCSCCMSAPAVELFSSVAAAAFLYSCPLSRLTIFSATSMSAITLSVRLFSFMLLCIWLVGELFLCLRSCLTVSYVAPLFLLCPWSCLNISLICFVSLI